MRDQRFLFISTEGCCSELARQAADQGAQVRLFIEDPGFQDVGDGFVAKSRDWRADVPWADVVVFDDTQGRGALAEALRAAGKRVIGGTAYTDRLEDDRAFAFDELARHGIAPLPSVSFPSIEAAMAYIDAAPGCYVAKPGGAAQVHKSLVFVGEDPRGRDVREVLGGYLRSQRVPDGAGVQLQRRAFGVEVGIGAFFDGERFLQPLCVAFEHKRLFPGDIGPLTGEMGTTMVWSAPTALFTRTIARMEGTLRAQRYTGYFDLNCIANAQGIWPLELTCRFGFPTISLQLEGMDAEVPALLAGMASGGAPELRARTGAMIAVRLRLPPYPYRDPSILAVFGRDVEIRVQGDDLRGVRIEDARRVDGRLLAAGESGAPLVVTAAGETMAAARALCYERVARVRMPNVFFRNDIGHSFDADVAALRGWGYL